jgi:hypothetical protein
VIVKIGAIEVDDYETLREAIQKAEKKTKIVVERKGEKIELDVEFDK